MQTISKLIEDGKKLLDEQNIENSLYDARRLMMEVYEKDLGFILCNPNAEVDDENIIRHFAESMISDITDNGSVIVYNKAAEKRL